jgi:mRNA-degrading endonuclease RelE of RelBE toxin-antitoxin system
MKVAYTPTAFRSLRDAPSPVRDAFFKQLGFLERNLAHPSLLAKKYDEKRDLWQARINRSWPFYFKIVDDSYIIEKIIPHPK